MSKSIEKADTEEILEQADSNILRSRFVGRKEEIKMLQKSWDQAQDDQGKLVLISGQSGVGKTCLVQEFATKVEITGGHVVFGQCVEKRGMAYRPWREVLWLLMHHLENAEKSTLEMERVGPVLATLIPEFWKRPCMNGLAPPATMPPEETQQRLHETISQVLSAAADLQPRIIIIEDAQWADEASLSLMSFLTRSPQPKNLMVCVTYCTDKTDTNHSLKQLEERGIEHISLSALTPEATRNLACSMLGLEDLPDIFMKQVQQITEGNAFFVQELIYFLALESVVLCHTTTGWHLDLAALKKVCLPQHIDQLMELRLNHLSKETQQVIESAAVIGQLFWEKLVMDITQLPREQVKNSFIEALDHGLIVEREAFDFKGEQEFIFKAPVVQKVCYGRISPDERQAYHAKAAAWIKAHSKEQADEYLGLIADHLEQAGQKEQALTYLMKAGGHAAAQFANKQAMDYLSRALHLIPKDALAKRYTALLICEQINDMQGDRKAQEQDLTALEKLAESMNDNQRRIEVANRKSLYHQVTGDYKKAIDVTQALIHLAESIQDVNGLASGYSQLGSILHRQGNFKEGLLKLELALTLARAASLRQVEAHTLAIIGNISRRLGDFSKSIIFLEKALAIYRELSNPDKESTQLMNIGIVFFELGNYAEAKAYYENALFVTSKIVFPRGKGMTLVNMAALHHAEGDDEEALECSKQALLIGRNIGYRRLEGYALTFMGGALVGLGRIKEAESIYHQALNLKREEGQHYETMKILTSLAQVSLVHGDLSQAQTQIEEVLCFEKENTLIGAYEPFQVYLTCYRVLCGIKNPRAKTILSTAHRLLQEQAVKISDEKQRNSFLENVVANKEIVQLYAKTHSKQKTSHKEGTARTEDIDRKIDDKNKTKEQLIKELREARLEISELKTLGEYHKQAEETLWESDKRFRSVAENAGDAIIIFDGQENVIFWNRVAQDIFGYSPNKTRNRVLVSALIKKFHLLYQHEIESSRTAGNPELVGKTMELLGDRRDGSTFPLEISLSAWSSKDTVFITVIGRDITDRKKAEVELKAFSEKLKKSNDELQYFAYIASHDLQEPLRKVITFGDQLKLKSSKELSDKGLDYLSRMQNAANRMKDLIDGLLVYARVTTKSQPFTLVDLGIIAKEVLSDLEVRIAEVKGQVEINDLPTIDADPLQMRQLFQNLISNAMKFHKKDESPKIIISSKTLDEEKGDGSSPGFEEAYCQISFKDNGIGFDEKFADRIFGVFHRLHGRDEYAGSGIGLSVCKKIAERHRGSISAKSIVGKGSTFTLTIPIKQPQTEDQS